jgi:hypothetical protein
MQDCDRDKGSARSEQHASCVGGVDAHPCKAGCLAVSRPHDNRAWANFRELVKVYETLVVVCAHLCG